MYTKTSIWAAGLALSLWLVAGCAAVPSQGQATKVADTASQATRRTWAEVSVKQGGQWNERRYEGGQFVGLDSLRVPAQHTDHSYYIRYEGLGWESNRVAYRLYLDWRNAIDVFGKLTDSLVLHRVGQDGFESYHHMAPWGMDLLKVGKGLGLGSLGRWNGSEVLHFQQVDSTRVRIANTDAQSAVHIQYHGWATPGLKTTLTSKLSIAPDARHTQHVVRTSAEVPGLCTGIVNHGVTLLADTSANGQWAYLATYGSQTLVPDNLGMALLYRTSQVQEQRQGPHDHLLIFRPTTHEITYYLLAAWEQEPKGLRTKAEFEAYLNTLLTKLDANDEI